MRIWISLVICLALLVVPAPVRAEEQSATVMVYLCGSDLESDSGAASADIEEMLAADIGGGLRIVLETGGTREWQFDGIRGDVSQRHVLDEDGLTTVETLDRRDMTDPDTLADFIQFCAENYPADRNILILWDHGGGSLYGFGADEHHPEGTLSIDEIALALQCGGVYFDIVGFDACLMATIETALALAEGADYLIASEETEPGTGWHYTPWLDALAADPGMAMPELGRIIIDEYIESLSGSDLGTLSMIDLDALSNTAPQALDLFAEQAHALIEGGQYAALSKARGKTKHYGYDEYDLVDLIDLIERSEVESADRLVQDLKESVIYNQSTANVRVATGLSVYFPYTQLSALDDMLSIYDKIDWSERYIALTQRFANVMTGGQTMIQTQSPFSEEPGGGFWSDLWSDDEAAAEAFAAYQGFGWFDMDAVQDAAEYVGGHHLSGDELAISEKGDGYVLRLADDEWALINDIQLTVFVDDGEGYIDLGQDDVYDYDADGDLVVDFDYTWVALDGQPAVFYSGDYVEIGDSFRYTGYVPARVNGVDSQIVLMWDSERKDGYVAGVRPAFSTESLLSRGLAPLRDGDVVQMLCDYYDYDGELEDEYEFGEPIVVGGEIQVSYEDIGDESTLVSYRLTDIYANSYWTEPLAYE